MNSEPGMVKARRTGLAVAAFRSVLLMKAGAFARSGFSRWPQIGWNRGRISRPYARTKGIWTRVFVVDKKENPDEKERRVLNLQNMILTLHRFWSEQNCIIVQPYDVEKGAGTMNPMTFLRSIGRSRGTWPMWNLHAGRWTAGTGKTRTGFTSTTSIR